MNFKMSWTKGEAASFTASLKALDLDYQSVCDLCEERGMARPSQQPVATREAVLRRLATEEGRAAYDAVANSRAHLLLALRACKRAEIKIAADDLGLPSAISELRQPDLVRLLAAISAQLQSPTSEADEAASSRCASCDALVVWVQTSEGKFSPCDPEILHATKGGRGSRVSLIGADGMLRGGINLDPEGEVTGRISHFATCPAAKKLRSSG